MGHKIVNVRSLFPTPLAVIRIEDHERINAELMKEIAARREKEQGIIRSNREGWHSGLDFFQRKEPAHRELAQAIMKAVAALTRRMGGKATDYENLRLECDGWVNVNPEGGYNTPHDHPGSFWSGAYYVSVPDKSADKNPNSGAIEFIDHRSAPAGQGLVKAPSLAGIQTFHPNAGTLLVFPSGAKHWVHPNTSEEDRVTIAFNARVTMNVQKMRQAMADRQKQVVKGTGAAATKAGAAKKPAAVKKAATKKAPAKKKAAAKKTA
ncbi:TIGR02466 family protein [Sphingomicrobium sediminis]|uniref:TIGR02466 family protein n=1 Tax=Sphingomicrobium sediminis TaxID=2950949 RepID=A0A9X2EK80_9SPHN|nr:TIGR02466 family protein [Sphingomicrobium sediminis]MCM8557134.1 TIGR02466 family protein [Sphingomicrobium sediminis]